MIGENWRIKRVISSSLQDNMGTEKIEENERTEGPVRCCE